MRAGTVNPRVDHARTAWSPITSRVVRRLPFRHMVSALVDTVGASKFWNSTAIFVQWDDWGGSTTTLRCPDEDYDGVGCSSRISPYAKKGYVAKVQYETASVLRFAEDFTASLQLAAADTRATSPAAVL